MKSQQRLNIQRKIAEFENLELWHKDVEEDPETIPLLPNKVDYLNKKLISKIMKKISNKLAKIFFEKKIKKNQLIIKDVRGIENFREIKSGAIITCNHFNPFDNYAVYRAIKNDLKKKNLHKVIREGNYTNFPGFYGLLFKHCNTLPLSSNTETMKKFMSAVSTLLKRGEKILIYPEQSMWWNYKKPRPLQSGGFKLASKNKVPIIPIFITMEDSSQHFDSDGFNVQEYTINILPAIYPNEKLSTKEDVERMKSENYRVWKKAYEDFYKIPLSYKTENNTQEKGVVNE